MKQILRLSPNRVWRSYPGGRVLDGVEGHPQPVDDHFPEDWIASTTRARNPGRDEFPDEGLSTVDAYGPSLRLVDLISADPAGMLGVRHAKAYGSDPRILVKLLDAAVRLHVQAHPTVAFSRTRLGADAGKAEAYYILHTRPETPSPSIYLGFNRSVDRNEFARWVETQDIERLVGCLHRLPVRRGDCFMVPGGFPHAIGEGVLMIEVMEPTDFVARLEFDRGGYVLPFEARFMGRNLDFGLDMIDFRSLTLDELRAGYFAAPRVLSTAVGLTRESLIDDRYTDRFRVERWRVTSEAAVELDSFAVMICTGGRGFIGKEACGEWSRYFVPPRSELSVGAQGELELIVVLPPR